MDWEQVISSNILAIGYDSEQKILGVEFKDRTIYHYFDVPQFEHSKIMNASSKGSYLHSHIKGKYRYKQVK